MIASLPMYHGSPARVAKFWRHFSARLAALGLRELPEQLIWPSDLIGHWQQPGLLLSQACGYPLVTALAGKVQLVGGFHYTAPSCEGVSCRSQLVVRAGDPATTLADLRGRRVAYNGTDSQSGYNSLRAMVAPLSRDGRFFGGQIETGAHHQSVLAVRDGLADIASIDCVSLAGFNRFSPELVRGIRVLTQSAPYPGLPLITARDTPAPVVQALRDALAWTTRESAPIGMREDLFICGFEPLELATYAELLATRDAAFKMGCRAL